MGVTQRRKSRVLKAPIFWALVVFVSSIISIATPVKNEASATCEYDETFYQSNDIMNYNECAISTCATSGVTLGDVSDIAKQKAEAAGIKEKAEANMDIYEYAAEATGVPWQIVAALHYREGGMNREVSIADGSPLTSGQSADGLVIYSDAKEDAADKIGHFLRMAQGVYSLNIDSVSSWGVDDWGNAFLAYNRGSMYKSVGQSYTLSPYVMNYIDDEHANMAWTEADSYYNGKKYNNLYDSSQKDANIGALAVANYLGLEAASSSEATANGSGNCGGVGAVQNDIVQTAINLSWINRAGSGDSVNRGPMDAKQEYIDAMEDVGLYGSGCSGNGADCGVFVATVMRSSGADTNFPIGTSYIMNYLKSSTEYEQIENKGNTSNLEPGDIFIIDGHIFMYVGNVATDGGKNMASASCNERTADRGLDVYFSDYRGTYEIFRKK